MRVQPAALAGTEPEPRDGVRAGHMPGSINLHYEMLLTEDGTLKDSETLAEIFRALGVNRRKPVITSCGSGVTAAILVLALQIIGNRQTAIYDGSWTEWGRTRGTAGGDRARNRFRACGRRRGGRDPRYPGPETAFQTAWQADQLINSGPLARQAFERTRFSEQPSGKDHGFGVCSRDQSFFVIWTQSSARATSSLASQVACRQPIFS